MVDLRTISEITGDLPVEETSGLQVWFNKLLSKRKNEIDIKDILIMFRQNIYVYIAKEKAVEYLEINPFVGELSDCELLVHIAKMDLHDWSDIHIKKIKRAMKIVDANMDLHNWIFDEDKYEAKEAIKLLIRKL